eukprot:COSAG06_NODE_823_length_12076_cov_7.312432_6_plen_121_part_00
MCWRCVRACAFVPSPALAGARQRYVGKQAGYVKNRPALMGALMGPPMASQVFSVSRLVSAFFEIEPRGGRQIRGKAIHISIDVRVRNCPVRPDLIVSVCSDYLLNAALRGAEAPGMRQHD